DADAPSRKRQGSFRKQLLRMVGEGQGCGCAFEIVRRKQGQNSAAQAAHRAIPVHFSLSGVHDTPIALAVNDLSDEVKRTKVLGCRFRLRCGACVFGQRARNHFDHGLVSTKDESACKPDGLVVVLRDVRAYSVFAGTDEEIAGRTGGGVPRPCHDERGIGAGFDRSSKRTGLAKFERGCRERILQSGDRDRASCPCENKQDDDPTHEAACRWRRCGQVAHVKLLHDDTSTFEILAGSTRVPGGFGCGSIQTHPPTILLRNVETFSVKGGGDAPVSGKYW